MKGSGISKTPKNKHIEQAHKKIKRENIKKEKNRNAYFYEFEARGIPLNTLQKKEPEPHVNDSEDDAFDAAFCMDVEGEPRPQESAFALMQRLIRTKDEALVYTSARAEAEHDFTYFREGEPLPDQYMQPDPLVALWPHQEEAIEFFRSREVDEQGVGGHGLLLADEMGLGKTRQGLVYVLRENQRMQRLTGRRFNGTTLVVTPKIVIETWQQEIEKSFEPGTFHCVSLTGDRHVPPDLVHIENCIDIVFTTYPVLAFVYKALSEASGVVVTPDLSATATAADASTETRCDAEMGEILIAQMHRYQLLYQKRWVRVLMDEAHTVASRAERTFRAVSALKAHSKWLLTGTPIQNSEDNIYACLELMDVPTQNVVGAGLVALRKLLDKVKIRRLKSDIRSLSFHIEVDRKVVFIDFESPVEHMLYLFYAEYAKSIINQKRKAFVFDTENGGKREKNHNITSLILIMRQLCMDFRIIDKLILPNGMLLLSDSDHRASLKQLSFGQKLWRDESTQYVHAPYSGNEELERKAFRLGDGATTYEYEGPSKGDSGDPVTQMSVTWDPYKAEDEMGGENELTRPLCETIYTIMCQEEEKNHAPTNKMDVVSRIYGAMGFESMDQVIESIQNDDASCATVSQIDQITSALQERALPAIATKPACILRYLNEEMPETDKAIVFSSSVMSLLQLARYLTHQGMRYILVTGESTSKGDQNSSRISRFKKDPTIRVALMSLKVGNMGLNMEDANNVLFVDIWWNPHVQRQGEFRVQRPGQTKCVHVRYFIIRGTIEEYILELCHYKTNLSHHLIENNNQADAFSTDEGKEAEVIAALANNKELRKQLFGYTINCISRKD